MTKKTEKVPKAGRLTSKQEAFAFEVGFNKLNYKEAYLKIYKIKKNKNTDYHSAYKLSSNERIKKRIFYWSEKRVQECKDTLKWNYKEAEETLLAVIKKNKNDLLRAEMDNKTTESTVNNAIINATRELNALYKTIRLEDNDIQKAKLEEEVKMLKNKNRLFEQQLINPDETVKIEINI